MIPVSQILDHYHVDVLEDRPSNVNIYCSCPFHKGTGKTPQNFSINRINGRWVCFNPDCPAQSGSIIRFVQLSEGCTRAVAREMLKNKFAVKNIPWKRMLKAMKQLEAPAKAGPLVVARWPKGMEPIPRNHPWIKRRRYRAKDFRPFKVSYDATRPTHIFFPVIFRHKLRGFTARDIRQDPYRKWEHDYGLPRRRILYNYDMAARKDYVFVCEGPLDVIRLHRFGYAGAVALFGAKGTPEQIALILETWDKVVVALDNDDAGNAGADKLCESLKKHVKFCAKLILPKGTDIDDLRRRKELLSHIKEQLEVKASVKRERSWDDLRKQWS